MATSPAVTAAMATLRERRLTLFEASRKRNYAVRHKVFDRVPALNVEVATARAAWLAARDAVRVALEEL